MTKQALLKEKATREFERRYQEQRESLVSFIEFFFAEELNKPFQVNWHHNLIEEKLQAVLKGEVTRLIINIPPGSGKTELITKCFPVWALGNKPETQIIATGYSAQLTQRYGSEARDYYMSSSYKRVFPRRPDLREDQNTKGLWRNDKGGQYIATGTAGSITGNRANIFIIDDPIKPDDAMSDVKRTAVNNWYDNTVLSRLFNPNKDAVIIVMQRTHEDDLCGYLVDKMNESTGEDWDQIIVKAIAEEPSEYREYGESYHEERFPTSALRKIEANDAVVFSTQYQQEPVNKESQEFHEEFFKYYDDVPNGLRKFTVVDPAFKQKEHNDETAIITGGFKDDELYILEITHGRYDASQLIQKVIFHAKKWRPEKVGVEGYAAQTVMGQWLKKTLKEEKVYIPVDEIIQKGSKEEKIRGLQGPIRHGKVFWRKEHTPLELQLRKFPRGKHDDIIDAMQMLYHFYNVQPSTEDINFDIEFKYDHLGRPIFA